MGAGLSLPRTLVGLALAACCGFAHGFEPLTLAGDPPLLVQWQASLAELDQFLAQYPKSK